MATIGDELYRNGYFDKFRSINKILLIALDGTDFFSSKRISCPGCTQSKLKNGKTLNRHISNTPVLVAPGQKNVIALTPQFVQPQDVHDKQDYELAAAGRWFDQWGAHYAPWGITYLGDDLYYHQPHCARILEQHSDFARLGDIATVVQFRRIGKKKFTDTYRYANRCPCATPTMP